jgi:hypothetical protein
MTASPTPAERVSLVSPVVEYEPAPVGVTACRSTVTLRRRAPRPLRPVPHPPVSEVAPPRAAMVFADAALRRVLEVIDRRRPIAQLRPLLAPALIDSVIALTRSTQTGGTAPPKATRTGTGAAATLRRIRLRMVDGEDLGAPRIRSNETLAVEVFGTYSRGPRVRAIAARVEYSAERWRIVALQLG